MFGSAHLVLRVLLMISVISVFAALSAELAHAQLMPGVDATQNEAPKGLDILLEEARKDGSTVIVVRPGDSSGSGTAVDASAARAEEVLKARARVQEILASVPTLWPNIQKTLQLASPEGGFLWIAKAFGTALLGLLIGWFAIKPIQKWGRQYFGFMYDPNPATTADKAKYLLFRIVLALVYAVVFFVVAISVAVIFDPVLSAPRRLIFEVVLIYVLYRVMKRAVSWNLFAYDAPSHRLVNLDDDEAIKMDRDWGIAVVVVLVLTSVGRFLSLTGEEQQFAGLTVENARFLQICSAAIVIIAFAVFTLLHWKSWQHIFAPRKPEAWMFRFRSNLARLVPAVLLLYSVLAFGMFVFRLALEKPAPGIVIGAPFAILFAAMIVYGVVLIVIQSIYERRISRFEELAAAERERQENEAEQINADDSEEIIEGPAKVSFEYQPAFRSFFENAALAIIVTVALGELGRIWGFGLGNKGNPWSAVLNIALAATLCWLAYRAVTIFIDRRLAEEGGAPSDGEELGGEGGGAGSSRMATLLPIARYVLIIALFSTASMVILSTLGFDIGPIFAGAGVVGIAVGFGAQTLIRDIFSGAFFLMDDAFRKDEYVEIDGIKGTVEKISIRSFQLRHHLGALDTIPFGEIRHLKNYSRDWVLMKLPLRVTYDTDVDKVRKLIKKLGQALLEHPQIGHTFMQPLKSQGVYKMEDSAMIIRVKFMTKPGEQFVTRKIVYESIQELFAAEGIHFAHKEVTVRLADGVRANDLSDEQKQAATSAARSVIDDEQAAAVSSAPTGDR